MVKKVSVITVLLSIGILLVCCKSKEKGLTSVENECQEILELNLATYCSFEYGDNGGLVYLEDVKESGIAACGNFSRQLAYDLRRKGYDCDLVGVRSWYMDAIHVMVEVTIPGKTYLLDPSNGLYYPNRLEELIEDPALSKQRVVQHDGVIMAVYACEEFFDGVYHIEREDGVMDCLERLTDQDISVKIEGDIVEGNDEKNLFDDDTSTFLQTDYCDGEQTMEIALTEKTPIGYMGILAYSAEEVKNILGGGKTSI